MTVTLGSVWGILDEQPPEGRRADAHTHVRRHKQTHRHTDTQTHRHTDTQTHVHHTRTHAYCARRQRTHTHTSTRTRTHAQARVEVALPRWQPQVTRSPGQRGSAGCATSHCARHRRQHIWPHTTVTGSYISCRHTGQSAHTRTHKRKHTQPQRRVDVHTTRRTHVAPTRNDAHNHKLQTKWGARRDGATDRRPRHQHRRRTVVVDGGLRALQRRRGWRRGLALSSTIATTCRSSSGRRGRGRGRGDRRRAAKHPAPRHFRVEPVRGAHSLLDQKLPATMPRIPTWQRLLW
jgi:hypothetical protein